MDARRPDAVGARQQAVAERRLAVAELDRLRAQHQMRKIDIPRMRRHVRTFRHVADVAQIALVDDLDVVGLRHAVDLHRLAFVDEIEQCRKGLAQAHAAAAPMADVEDALHLLVERAFVVERGIAPRDRMPGRGVEAAFAGGHSVIASNREVRGREGLVAGAPRVRVERRVSQRRSNADVRDERRALCDARSRLTKISQPKRPELSGSGSRASAPPSRASRTSRRSRRSLRCAPTSPCPDTCRCTRAFRRRSRP